MRWWGLVLCLLGMAAAECLVATSGMGLTAGFRMVPGTPFVCHNRSDCVAQLCRVNDHPAVAWVIFGVS